MTGIIICDKCGILFIGNGNLEKIKTPSAIVLAIMYSNPFNWKGIRKVTSKLGKGGKVVPEFDGDICHRCSKK